MGADLQSRTPEHHGDRLTAPDVQRHGPARIGGEIRRNRHFTLPKPHVLPLLQWTDHLGLGEKGCRPVQERRTAIQRIRQDRLDSKVRMIKLKLTQPGHETIQFAGIGRLRFRSGGAFGLLHAWLLERVVGLLPCRDGRVRLIEPKPDRQADFGRHQEQQDHGLTVEPTPSLLIENFVRRKNALRDFRASMIAIVPDSLPLRDVVFPQNQPDADLEPHRPEQLAMPEHPR